MGLTTSVVDISAVAVYIDYDAGVCIPLVFVKMFTIKSISANPSQLIEVDAVVC